MKQEIWKRLINALPPDLTVEQVSRMLRHSENLVRRRLVSCKYKFLEKPKHVYELPAWVHEADWKLPNVDIAQWADVSRERVRQLRNLLGHPFVESRGRKSQNGKVSLRKQRGADKTNGKKS